MTILDAQIVDNKVFTEYIDVPSLECVTRIIDPLKI
jgi:hypothetical protein